MLCASGFVDDVLFVYYWPGSVAEGFVLDSGAVGPRFKSLRQTVHTHRASVHQTATLAVAILTVSGVTAGLK